MIVEVDPETMQIDISRYVVVHDCGRVLNPLIVDGQVHGGVAQGLGNAFYEELVFDDNGQLLNGSLMDFLLPTALEVPRVTVGHLETPSPLNELGSKGAGEAGAIPVGGALRPGARGRARDSGARDPRHPAQPQPSVGARPAGARHHGHRRTRDRGDDDRTPRRRADRRRHPTGPAALGEPHQTAGWLDGLRCGASAPSPPRRERVWEALLDPETLARSLPGCESLERLSETTYRGTLSVQVGPVKSRFDGTLELSDVRPGEGYSLELAGEGPAGHIHGEGLLSLSERREETGLSYRITTRVGGRLAGVGQRLLETSARAVTEVALESFERQVEDGAEAPPGRPDDRRGQRPGREAGRPRVASGPVAGRGCRTDARRRPADPALLLSGCRSKFVCRCAREGDSPTVLDILIRSFRRQGHVQQQGRQTTGDQAGAEEGAHGLRQVGQNLGPQLDAEPEPDRYGQNDHGPPGHGDVTMHDGETAGEDHREHDQSSAPDHRRRNGGEERADPGNQPEQNQTTLRRPPSRAGSPHR